MFEKLNAGELRSELMRMPIDGVMLVDALIRLCDIVCDLEVGLATILPVEDLDNRDEDVLVTRNEFPF